MRGTVCGRGLLAGIRGPRPRATADGVGRRIPSVPIPHHTHILLARARAPYSPPRLRNGSFAHASRSGGQRNLLELQALHPAQPPAPELAMARYGLRTRPPGGEPEAVDSDEAEAADGDGRRTPSGPIPHHTHILLARVLAPYSPRYHRNGNCTRARRSEGPRHRSDGFHILTTCVRVVECAPASLYSYSSPLHRFPDERTPIEAMPLPATSAELGSGLGCGFGIGLTRVGFGFGTGFTHYSTRAPLLFATLLALCRTYISAWWSDSSTQAAARSIP